MVNLWCSAHVGRKKRVPHRYTPNLIIRRPDLLKFLSTSSDTIYGDLKYCGLRRCQNFRIFFYIDVYVKTIYTFGGHMLVADRTNSAGGPSLILRCTPPTSPLYPIAAQRLSWRDF